jgi:hypothetical protein
MLQKTDCSKKFYDAAKRVNVAKKLNGSKRLAM